MTTAALILSAVVIVFVVIGGSQSFHHCIEHTKYSKPYYDTFPGIAGLGHSFRRDQLIISCGARFLDVHNGLITAIATAVVGVFTFTLGQTTQRLFITGERQLDLADRSLKEIQRAFIFIEGFNTELTDGTILSEEGRKNLREAGFDDVTLFVSRFAAQPRWKNSGNTPARDLRIKTDWRCFTDFYPDVFTYKGNDRAFFIGPNAIEKGEMVEMPGLQAVINYANKPANFEPLFLIWGQADYKDVFDKNHVTKWCYRVRLDRHDGKKLNATFIQWGDHNSAT